MLAYLLVSIKAIDMKVGILGAGPVGRSFGEVLLKYGHEVYAFDINPDRTKGLPGGVYACGCEEEVGAESDLFLGCTDMFSGYALTKAAKAMPQDAVFCEDFSAKAPAQRAFENAYRKDLAYWSIHTLFAPPPMNKPVDGSFKGKNIVEIPASGCWRDDGTERPQIAELRRILEAEGAEFNVIYTIEDHDRRMGRVQGATSAENICTARTLAGLGINPLREGSIYANGPDRVNFLMALRAIGEKGSSNPCVYGGIATMNPFALRDIIEYSATLESLLKASPEEAADMLRMAVGTLGRGRIEGALARWRNRFEKDFGPSGAGSNSGSSHLAEGLLWSQSDYPMDMFDVVTAPPYKMRGMLALIGLADYERCLGNMLRGGTHDKDFLRTVGMYSELAEKAAKAKSVDSVVEFEKTFFTPVREEFPDDIKDINKKTNDLIAKMRD